MAFKNQNQGILDDILNQGAAQNQKYQTSNRGRVNGQTQTQERAKSEVFVVVGYEKGDRFISIPGIMGVDTANRQKPSGSNEDYVASIIAENALLDMLEAKGFSLEPGGHVDLNLTVRLRRRAATSTMTADESPYAPDFDLFKE